MGRKQPKTCVWVSAVGGRAFLQRSQSDKSDKLNKRSSETENTIRNVYNIVSILFPPLLSLFDPPFSSKGSLYPYSPSVIYRNGRERAIWRGRSRHSAPARQSFPITSVLTAHTKTVLQPATFSDDLRPLQKSPSFNSRNPNTGFRLFLSPKSLLILPKYPLNPPRTPHNQASGPPFRRQQAHLAC